MELEVRQLLAPVSLLLSKPVLRYGDFVKVPKLTFLLCIFITTLNVDMRYRDASFTAIYCNEVLKAWTFKKTTLDAKRRLKDY